MLRLLHLKHLLREFVLITTRIYQRDHFCRRLIMLWQQRVRSHNIEHIGMGRLPLSIPIPIPIPHVCRYH